MKVSNQLEVQSFHTHLFPDLQQFKQIITAEGNGTLINPYTVKKQSVLNYRIIFALIGLLFFGLAYITLFAIPYNTFWHHFLDFRGIQWMLTAFSLFIGTLSCWISFSLKAEQEALNYLFHYAKRKLGRIYIARKSELTFRKFLPFGNCYEKTQKLRHGYQSALETVEKHRDEFKFLLKKIAYAAMVSAAVRETLYNQALMEFRLKIESVLHSFELS